MFSFRLLAHFKRRYKKLIKRDTQLEDKLRDKLNRLAENPKDPILKSHKVIASYDLMPAMSSAVTGDLRIIWRYAEDGSVDVIDLVDLGGHSGSNKVYQ